MERSNKRKEEVNTEILKKEEKEPLYMKEQHQKILLLYTLMTNTSNTVQSLGFGTIIPPMFFKKLLD